ncbi:MAG TPA: BMP family ABC transporter substrate-binding protein [Gaiellales bacterium]|jgi:basic membrane protein A|nr:BMP family ABC transporter substrate-binding protein [Gaiellales bacterium]
MLLAIVAMIAIATTTATAKQSRSHATIKVGLVTDIAGLGDKSFNYLAGRGLTQAEKKYGVQGDVTVSKSNNDYVPNITKYALKGYDLVIAVGFLEEQAVGQVAKKFPKVKFAIVDDSTSVKALKGLKNVEGLLYKEWESGYLAGYLGGLFEQTKAKGLNSSNVMSTVGGIAIPPVDHYIAGFQAGAKAADPGVKLLNGYSGDFVAQDKCQGLAQQQIAQGSDIVFQVAGQCGLGAINAARDKGLWGIGVDTNQALQIGPKQLLVSATKGVDVSVVDVVGQVVNNKFRGGKDLLLGVNENGAGIQGINSAVPASIKAKVAVLLVKMKAGKVKIPTVPIVK